MKDEGLRLPTVASQRVLLINPPVYDTRFHWSQWHQPTKLLRLASHFKSSGVEVRLVDTLYSSDKKPLKRQRVNILSIDGVSVRKWRHGIPASEFEKQLKELAKSGWIPDEIFVECFVTFWWEGVAEVCKIARKIFPTARIGLFGAYPSIEPQHARDHTQAVIEPNWDDLDYCPADLSLYPVPPSFAYLTLGGGKRSLDSIIEEMKAAKKLGIRQFAFAEDAPASQFTELFRSILEKIAAENLGIKFYALGSISPANLVEQEYLAPLLKAAGYAQIWLADDRHSPSDVDNALLIENYRIAGERCKAAGFKLRTDEVVAAVCLGKQGENLAERVKLATLAAHHIGSVIFWAYQPAPGECPDVSLEMQNGKLFPLRHANGYTYRNYLDVLGLAAVLNSKHRAETFDFMGKGMIARMLRDSLERRAWEPDDAVKGGLQLPLRIKK